ncbi:hypothetical protein [Bradyrhizobium sp.]|uniref:hypothetical protein n=1 Tax=Bradyrhizobium sp. TaxID=376 RepID=UPI003C711B29
MNQRADSWKKNLQLIVPKPLIYQRGWILSHTDPSARPKIELRGVRGERVVIFRRIPANSTAIDRSGGSPRPGFFAKTAGG